MCARVCKTWMEGEREGGEKDRQNVMSTEKQNDRASKAPPACFFLSPTYTHDAHMIYAPCPELQPTLMVCQTQHCRALRRHDAAHGAQELAGSSQRGLQPYQDKPQRSDRSSRQASAQVSRHQLYMQAVAAHDRNMAKRRGAQPNRATTTTSKSQQTISGARNAAWVCFSMDNASCCR